MSNNKVYQVFVEGETGKSLLKTFSSFEKAQTFIGKTLREEKWKPGDVIYFSNEYCRVQIDTFVRLVVKEYQVE